MLVEETSSFTLRLGLRPPRPNQWHHSAETPETLLPPTLLRVHKFMKFAQVSQIARCPVLDEGVFEKYL